MSPTRACQWVGAQVAASPGGACHQVEECLEEGRHRMRKPKRKPWVAGFGGCEASRGIAQASAGREISYAGPRRLRTRLYRRAKAARKCSEVGNGTGVGWSQAVANGLACFGAARKLVDVAARVGNA
ncbi:hypothetical protein EDB89DRAFT_1908956 [Lactarius sanguifluus]|nr:hypothetical protein EDB89DRAFT_1908956 [Lactarius sanguifluus]